MTNKLAKWGNKMTGEEKALAKDAQFTEGLRTLRGKLFNLKGYLEATGYPVTPLSWVGEAIEVVTSLQQNMLTTEPDEPTLVRNTKEERAEHLARYLVNTAKRTGQEWVVVEQYHTEGANWRDCGYERALIRAEDGSTVRIYYKWWSKCWVRGQKVLAPK